MTISFLYITFPVGNLASLDRPWFYFISSDIKNHFKKQMSFSPLELVLFTGALRQGVLLFLFSCFYVKLAK